jgi:hypothetical protein
VQLYTRKILAHCGLYEQAIPVIFNELLQRPRFAVHRVSGA